MIPAPTGEKPPGPEPYWADETCALYLGDMREVLPALGITADLVLADPPYGETSLAWDRWPDGWLGVAAQASRSLWCFGSLRLYLAKGDEFAAAGWRLSQDVVMRKPVAASFARDRFRRVHELPTHWYRGRWGDIYHEVPLYPRTGPDQSRKSKRKPQGPAVHGARGGGGYADTGMRLAVSVLDAAKTRTRPGAGGRALHSTEKPLNVLSSLISYGCPPGGLIVDPFAGSCSTLDAARLLRCRAIGIELREQEAEKAATRLSQLALEAS